jgi:hypothetical protein
MLFYKLIRALFYVFLLAYSPLVYANNSHKSQLHVHTGFVMGALSGPTPDAELMVMPTFNFEYESFLSSTNSYSFKGIFAMDMEDAIVKYFFAGFSQRFYMIGRGSTLETQNRQTYIRIDPKINFYTGYSVGLSQAVAQTFTSVLQTFTTMLDIGGMAGVNYRLTSNIRLEAQLEISYAYGFSSVAISGMLTKGFFGISYEL